ncbi:exonuclease domain-containing protein [Lacinutrix sp.]|uniref:exonuclease domain-containing protein n=1 Tax=Lacinutrix sp. TaxID=1937692 RepID=UPI0035C82BDF
MFYTIIDVETSGRTNRITEISVFKYNGDTVVDEFTSLVNPNCYIPDHITALTGIDNGTVANAPDFQDIAQQILDITEDAIFVAHNVNFDYNVIRNEFKSLNIEFNRKKLCTVRLSRKLLPGHKSYSLGKLCKDLNINANGRHRARGDAEATVILFQKLQAQEKSREVFSAFLNKNSKEATLPPNLPKEIFNAIPNSIGIYYFKNKKGEIIYVGKAKDLKKRVLSTFIVNHKKAWIWFVKQQISISNYLVVNLLHCSWKMQQLNTTFHYIIKWLNVHLKVFPYLVIKTETILYILLLTTVKLLQNQ